MNDNYSDFAPNLIGGFEIFSIKNESYLLSYSFNEPIRKIDFIIKIDDKIKYILLNATKEQNTDNVTSYLQGYFGLLLEIEPQRNILNNFF